MDINFPLILVALTALAFVIWLADVTVLAPRRDPGRPEPVPVEYARSFLPVLAAVLVLRSFLVEPFQIPSSSMVPTLLVGDYILVNKFAWGIRLPVLNTKVIEVGQPERGDVMVFFPPNRPEYFIKRVIGLPGDHIAYHDKVLYVNGEQVPQELIVQMPPAAPTYQILQETLGEHGHVMRKELQRSGPDNFEITVEPGHYFMMGDNRDNSSDSRIWGQVPEANVVGKAFAVWMHWGSFLSIPDFSRVGMIR